MEFKSIEHMKSSRCIIVRYGEPQASSIGSVSALPPAVSTALIEGAAYDELMSPAPAWAPNKPAGVFREEDLWHFIGVK